MWASDTVFVYSGDTLNPVEKEPFRLNVRGSVTNAIGAWDGADIVRFIKSHMI